MKPLHRRESVQPSHCITCQDSVSKKIATAKMAVGSIPYC